MPNNIGAFGENFPYSNQHDMNMDWVIKIAKDFLDHYTEIQTIINDGKTDLTATATHLEELLNEWYNTHSSDIANQLTDALSSLNSALVASLASFNQQADQKATETIASIPDDYTEVEREVKNKNRCLIDLTTDLFEQGSLNNNGEEDDYLASSRIRTDKFYLTNGLTIKRFNQNSNARFTIYYYNNNNRLDSKTGWLGQYYIPKGTCVKLLMSLDPNSSTAHTVQEILNGFIIELDTNGISSGSVAPNGTNDNEWKYYERLRDSYIKHTEKELLIIGFVGTFTVTTYNENGVFVNQTSWNRFYKIPANTYYRCTYRIDDTQLFEPSDFSEHFEITDKTDFSEIIENNIINSIVRRGSYNVNDFTDYAKEKRISTSAKLVSKHDIIMLHNYGYLYVYLYDTNGNVAQVLTWRQNDCFIPAGQQFSFTIDIDINNPQATATDDELLNAITFRTMGFNECGLSPNIIFQCRNTDDTRYPPYSKYYIKSAYENQYDRVRVNIRVTTDNHFVLIHNNTINDEARNMDGTLIDTPISSSNQTLAYLNSFDWGIKYGNMYAGMRVPELEEACEFASKYNLGLTIETTDLGSGTATIRSNIDKIFTIVSKYGLAENLIVITASGQYFGEMEYWKTKSKYISYFIGGTENEIQTNKQNIDNLITGYNDIYAMPFPFGTIPTQSFIEWCINNGYKMYSSVAMSKFDLFNVVGFDKGNTLIECNNTYAIKTNIIRETNNEI